MVGHIVFNNYNIDNIINEIKITENTTHNTSPYIGTYGSNTNYISDEGRVISFKNLVTNDENTSDGKNRIVLYKNIAKEFKTKSGVLTSSSKSELKGNYIITKFDYTEDTGRNFICEWEFTEIIKFNVTKKTFRVWGKSTTSNNKNKNVVKKTSGNSNLNSNTKNLLKNCPTMSKGYNGKKCVKSLQKFLQSKGYYTKYKVDGIYAIYTEKAVKSLQKSVKLKSTGKWDKNTRKYFQKKYKYPTSVKKKK